MSPQNVAASVKARLQNKARESGRVYNELLQLYAMERFLYRLSKSAHSDKFVLKGALLFMVWNSRMKDFYDIWNIIRHEEIDGAQLQKACAATFERRDTPFDLNARFFAEAFSRSPARI